DKDSCQASRSRCGCGPWECALHISRCARGLPERPERRSLVQVIVAQAPSPVFALGRATAEGGCATLIHPCRIGEVVKEPPWLSGRSWNKEAGTPSRCA